MINKQNDRSFQKIQTLFLSVIIALILWIAIVNAVNPDVTETLYNIPIQTNGITKLRDNGFVMVNVNKLPKCTVKIKGKRKDIIESKDKIYAVINVSDINYTGTADVAVLINSPSSINIEKQSVKSVSAEIEACFKKEIPIFIKQENVPDDKLIESKASETETVEISGSYEDIGKISGCFILADLSQVTENSKLIYPFTYLSNEETQIVKPDTIYSPSTSILVTHTVYNKKITSLNIEIPEEIQKNYKIEFENLQTDEFVCGVNEKSKDFSEISYKLSMDDIKQEGENEIDLTSQLTGGVYIPEGQKIIKFEAKKLVTRHVNVEITEYNLKEGFKIAGINKSHEYTLRGTEEDLSSVSAKVNMEKLEAGVYTLPLEFENKNITSEQPCFAEVVIERKED